MRTRIIVSILLIAVWLAATISPTQAQSGYEWVEANVSTLQNLSASGDYAIPSPCTNPLAVYALATMDSDGATAYRKAIDPFYNVGFIETEGGIRNTTVMWTVTEELTLNPTYPPGQEETFVNYTEGQDYLPGDIVLDLWGSYVDLDITAAWYYCPIEPTATPTTEPTSTPGPTNVTIISLTGGDMTLERSISYGDVAVVIAILANIGTMIMYILLRLPRLWKR